MNTCITAALAYSSANVHDRQSISTTGLPGKNKSSIYRGINRMILFRLAVVAAILICTAFSAGAQSPAITLTAYSADGTNSGTARLGRNVTVQASVVGTSSPSVTWAVQGAGTISSGGVYTAPAAMPSNGAVNIIAALASNPAVSATYSLNLIYTAPTPLWVTPSSVLSGETTSVSISGNDFTAATTITVGGISVPAVFNGTNGVVAQIPVAAGVTAPLSIVATNPMPGGGSGVAASVSVKVPAMTLAAYGPSGTNSGTAILGRNVTLQASVAGMSSPAVTWAVQGAGTISSTGVYTAPVAMPSNGAVTITAALASNPAVSATYSLNLIYTAPTILWMTPSSLLSGETTSVSISGNNFTAATTITVGGVSVPAVFNGTNGVVAQIPVAAGVTAPLSIVASNPTPGGGSSIVASESIKVPAMTLAAYGAGGTNSGTAILGRNVTVQASVVGMSSPSVTWSVQGAGTISSSGVYTAPVAMPSNGAVNITAALASNPAVSATYSLNLIYAAPTTLWVTPSSVLSGVTTSVAISGNDFTAATTITVGGVSVPAVFNGTNGVVAQIPVAAGVTAPLSIVASNPTPGGGSGIAASVSVKTPVLTLAAYGPGGTNSGTAILGRNMTVQASVAGMSSPSVTWAVQGAGTISSAGVYTAPAAMPSNGAVTITAALASNPAVSAAYSLNLIYTAPTPLWVTPSSVLSGETTSVSISGNDFTAATTITVGGVSVPAVFNGSNGVVAQIAVAPGVTAPLSIVASNPTPGGGSGVAASELVKAPAMTLAAYGAGGTNSGTAILGRNVTVQASVVGMSAPSVTWAVQGAGSISSAGVYTAPSAMPSNGAVNITAALASDPTVNATYSLNLLYTAPTILWVAPSTLVSGATNAILISGTDFTAATTVTVNGAPVSGAFNGTNGVLAQIPIAAGSTTAVSVVAGNPTPGGGSSAAISATVQPLTMALSSYSTASLNPATASLGQSVQFAAVVSGGNAAAAWPITWTLQGPGNISSTGLYTAPSAMPSNSAFAITATLASNTSVTATSSMSLLSPAPVVNQSQPVQANAGVTNTITFFGQNFNPGTTIQANGQAVPTTYVSSNSVSASIPVAQDATGPVSITAVNPGPNGGQSGAFSLSIGDSSTFQATIGTTAGRAIPADFVGLSHEWGEAQAYMGSVRTGVNNIYRQLVQNLSNPDTPFFLRIGGGSTDTSVEPTAVTVAAFSDLFNAMPVRFSLGVNLGANNLQLALDQASNFVTNMPSGAIAGIELGNEPDSYAYNGMRPSTYAFTDYLSDFATWNAGIAPLLPQNVKLMGPSLTTVWHLDENYAALEQANAANISIVSAHLYGGYVENATGTPTVFAPDYLLQPNTSTQNVPGLALGATAAHNSGQLFRIGETNSIDQGGALGISNTFSAALWAADSMFEDVNAGVDGINFHGTSGCNYCAFTFGIQQGPGLNTFRLQQVNPLYYGLLFFHEATTNSAQLLPVTITTTNGPNVKVWATVDASGTVHVAILNKDESFAGNVAITLPGYGDATAIRMVAPNYQSVAGIAIGGQTFDNSFDGNLIGSPMTESFAATNSVYTVPVQPTSAVLLSLTQ